MSSKLIIRSFGIAVLAGVAGCMTSPRPAAGGRGPAAAGTPFAAPTRLTAKLVDPINIDLDWQDNASNESGYLVEYSPNADNDFVIIDVLPPNSTHYRHPRLLPHTRFVYRVRPIFGDASNVAVFTTGPEGGEQQAAPADTAPPPAAGRVSLRGATAAAAPTDLTAELVPPAGVKLQWHDHASDADGYVFELKAPWAPAFAVSGFLKPGATSLVSYGFPFSTTFAVRVRAFVYGPASNLAEQTTGTDPTFPVAAADPIKH